MEADVMGNHARGVADASSADTAPNRVAPLRLTPSDKAMLLRWLHGRPDHTRRVYHGDIVRFLAHARKPLAAVTLDDLHDYADTLADDGLAPASRARLLNVVKSLLTFAHETGYLPFNAGHALRLPAVRTRLAERIPSEEDIVALLAHEPDRRNHALMRLLYTGGLRISEACTLCWRDLKQRDAAGQVTVWGKGNHERAVLLTGGIWREMMALRPPNAGPDDPVFRSRRGGSLSTTQAWRIVKDAAVRAELPMATALSPHWLRHAHASHALDRGAPVSLVRECLGHASLATTSRYTHARPGDGSSRYLPV
jgi:integrase/recombinase XerD